MIALIKGHFTAFHFTGMPKSRMKNWENLVLCFFTMDISLYLFHIYEYSDLN